MLTDLPNIQNVLEYIDNKYPEWVYKISDKFSKDYEYLNPNWCHMCNVFNTTPKKIIIVENMNNDEFYTLSELLTKVGFIIRSRDEYIYCLKCNKCIPTEKTYDKMKEKIPSIIPKSYSNCCSNC